MWDFSGNGVRSPVGTEAKAQQQSDLKQNGGDSSLSLENSSRQNNLVILFWVGGESKKQVEWKTLRL